MSVLIVRLGALGDLVHTLPALAALRRAHPDVRIDWLVDAASRPVLDLVTGLSSIVTLDRRSPGGWLDVRRRLRARRYDVALDFQGLLKSAALARLSGARRVVGFERAGLREPAARVFYSEAVPVPAGLHVIRKNLRLAAVLGADASGPLAFPFGPVDSPVLAGLRAQGVSRFALLNCGAAWPNKRWPPDAFGEVAAWLKATHDLPSVVLWGPGEQEAARRVVRIAGGAALEAPATGLRDLVALGRVADLMVSGDTGPTHVVAAVGTPVVALFGPTDPTRNGPWDLDDEAVSRYGSCVCHYQRRCHRPGAWCLGHIAVAEVCAAIDRRLRAGRT